MQITEGLQCKKGIFKNKSCGKEPEECNAKIKHYFLIAKKKRVFFKDFLMLPVLICDSKGAGFEESRNCDK